MTKKEKQEQPQEKHEQAPAPVAEDQVQKLAQEVLHWKDLALRTAAECENIKKRCALDMQNTARYATKDFAKDLLPVADNLARAIHQAQVEMGKSDKPCDPFFINLLQGVELTQKQLSDAFAKNHVVQMDDKGKVFDPEKHRVIQQVEDPSKPAGTIIENLQTGYMIHDRVLREAMVIVTKESTETKG